jgi:hypothetical protein
LFAFVGLASFVGFCEVPVMLKYPENQKVKANILSVFQSVEVVDFPAE